MQIAIIGVTGFRNRGVEALIRPTILHLLLRYKDAHVTVVTWSPDYDEARFPHPRVRYVRDHFIANGTWAAKSKAGTSHVGRFWRRAAQSFNATRGSTTQVVHAHSSLCDLPFSGADLVIVSGGDLFSSDYGQRSLNHFVSAVVYAKRMGIPCVLLGQSVGRFKSEEDIALWREAEAAASGISLREPLSNRYLVDDLGSAQEKFEVTADTAFLLVPELRIAESVDAEKAGPTVALAISESICKWTGNDYGRHIDAWVSIAKSILDEWGAQIYLIPHVQEPYSDDRVICTRIWRHLNFDPRVKVFAEDLSAAEYKAIIASCEMVIAERMHAAIAGLSSGVCTVPVGYSIKAEGILASVLAGTNFCASDLVMPIAELMDVNNAVKKLTNVWTGKDAFKGAIGQTLHRSQAEAVRNFELIDKIINIGGVGAVN